MKLDKNHIEIINQYLLDKGIDDTEILMELSDHLYSIHEQEKLEAELIPSDILSLSENGFDKYEFQKTYQELIDIRKGRLTFKNYVRELFNIKHLGLILSTLVVHRIIFFVILPGFIPFDIIQNVMRILMIITIIIDLSTPLYWLIKPYYKLKR